MANVREKAIWLNNLFAGTLFFIFLAVVILVASLLANGQTRHVQKNVYQAVFLTNGQAYFGKLKFLPGDNLYLTDVYYLQRDEQLQASPDNQNQKPRLSLVKLGDEVHGPQDELYIYGNQVLFWENLKENSQVVNAIMQRKLQHGAPPASQSTLMNPL